MDDFIAMLAHHTERPFTPEADRIEILDAETGSHVVEVRCLHCSESQPEWHRVKVYHVDKALIALAALHFHSHHEGHGMAVFVDGKKLKTQAPPERD